MKFRSINKTFFFSILLGLFFAAAVAAQLSTSSFRALGQPDLRQNGLNVAEGAELFNPNGLTLDLRGGELHVYVADTGNHRVLGWRNGFDFANGAPADLALGQPSLNHTAPLGIGIRGLVNPVAVAVERSSGDVYVTDQGNHRILRFPSPFENPASVEPNAVYGQADFQRRRANFDGVSAHSLNGPAALVFDALGNLWIADSLNHRVLRFASADLNQENPDADVVIGQEDFLVNLPNAGLSVVHASGFNRPIGVAFHPDNGALYVSDALNSRVLTFNSPQVINQPADRVLGQPDFETRTVPPNTTAASMRGPTALGFDTGGSLYVAIPGQNRILIFDNAAQASQLQDADRVLGQPLLTSELPNSGTHPRANASGLFNVGDLAVAPNGDVFAADTGNHRVVVYRGGASPAAGVLGQEDFERNAPNRLGPSSVGFASDVAVDYSESPFPIYVSDAFNNRVLGWRSSLRFENGAPADLVIGQADFSSSVANADTGRSQSPTATSLASPRGMAISAEGDLYVADSANNRVLRFARPFAQTGRLRADLVLGQGGFTSALSAAVSASSLRSPLAVALGAEGQVFVSDTGNSRVLEYPASPTNGAAAIRVFGQTDFETGTEAPATSAQSLSSPEGIYADPFGFLFVADSGAHRVLVFPLIEDTPQTGASASTVIGQDGFESAAAGFGARRLNVPRQVSLDSEGRVYVSDAGNHRIVIFPSLLFLPVVDAEAGGVLGQFDINGRSPNYNSPDGLATPQGLFAPAACRVDRNGTLYVGDTGNNRVVHFLRPAALVSAATFVAGVAVSPGSLVSMFGTELSEETEAAVAIPLPSVLAERTVEVAGETAPLLFASPGQFNIQLPVATATGSQPFAIRTAASEELIAGGQVVVSGSNPGLFTLSQDGTGQTAALNEDGSLNGPGNPAVAGSVLQLFGTGQGPTEPIVADGQPAPSGVLARTTAQPSEGVDCVTSPRTVCVAVGSKFGEVLFSGLAPGFVGLWQINVRIPADGLRGDAVPLRVWINQRVGNDVAVSIR